MKPADISPELFSLYDTYCHGVMDRREFLRRAAGLAGGLAMASALLPDYARACQVSFNDPRILGEYVQAPSPGGSADTVRGYLARPQGEGPWPAVLVVHENRGLNPYIEDVARRLAVEGFLAFAPDALSAVGGYPGNDDQGKALQRELDRDKILVDMANCAGFLKGHARSTGKLGAVGFCFGGFVCNHLAVVLGAQLAAAAPFYGTPGDLARAGEIRAKLALHYAEDDPRVNATREGYVAALMKAKLAFEVHTYPGTQHGFHNDSTPRFDAEAAELAWGRTLKLFREALA